jgi:transposase
VASAEPVRRNVSNTLNRIGGTAAHSSGAVWDFIRQQGGRIWIEFLPGYAPELNPVEYLWSHWKQYELPNLCPTSLDS